MKYWTKRVLIEAVSGRDILAGKMPEWLLEMQSEGSFESLDGYMVIDLGISPCYINPDDYLVMEKGRVKIVPYEKFMNLYESAE